MRELGIQMPTREEIIAAREALEDSELLREGLKKSVMDCWEGLGWHRDELLVGIVVGLEIAAQRNGKRER